MSGDVGAGLTEVLADLIAHHDAYRVNGEGWTVCICGHVAVDDDDDGSHARHVASIVAELVREAEQRAAVQALRDAADKWRR